MNDIETRVRETLHEVGAQAPAFDPERAAREARASSLRAPRRVAWPVWSAVAAALLLLAVVVGLGGVLGGQGLTPAVSPTHGSGRESPGVASGSATGKGGVQPAPPPEGTARVPVRSIVGRTWMLADKEIGGIAPFADFPRAQTPRLTIAGTQSQLHLDARCMGLYYEPVVTASRVEPGSVPAQPLLSCALGANEYDESASQRLMDLFRQPFHYMVHGGWLEVRFGETRLAFVDAGPDGPADTFTDGAGLVCRVADMSATVTTLNEPATAGARTDSRVTVRLTTPRACKFIVSDLGIRRGERVEGLVAFDAAPVPLARGGAVEFVVTAGEPRGAGVVTAPARPDLAAETTGLDLLLGEAAIALPPEVRAEALAVSGPRAVK